MDNLVSIGTMSKSSNGKPAELPAKMSNGAEIIFFPGVRYERTVAKSESRTNEESVTSQ